MQHATSKALTALDGLERDLRGDGKHIWEVRWPAETGVPAVLLFYSETRARFKTPGPETHWHVTVLAIGPTVLALIKSSYNWSLLINGFITASGNE
jgi:hypothetical protein